MRLPTALQVIEEINKLLTPRHKQLLDIVIGETTISVKNQLIADYGRMYVGNSLEDSVTLAARIIHANKHNFSKLEVEDELINHLKELETYYTTTETREETTKDIGIVGSSDMQSNDGSAGYNKLRDGTSQYGKEFDLDEGWDEQGQALIDSLEIFSGRHPESQNGSFSGNSIVVEGNQKVISQEDGEKRERTIKIQNPLGSAKDTEEQRVYFHTVGINTGQSATSAKGNVLTHMGREVKTGKHGLITKRSFVRAHAIMALQKFQALDVRGRILSQFKILFRATPCQ